MHIDPLAPILFWVTLLYAFAMGGRYLARRFHQPGVLGELLMGICVGNVCYALGLQLMVVLREGPLIDDLIKSMLQGMHLQTAILTLSISKPVQTQLLTALSSAQGLDYLKVAYILDVFSRYGVIFLLFLVGVESSFSDLKKAGRTSFLVALMGVAAPFLLGIGLMNCCFPTISFASTIFIGATLCATSIGVSARVLKELKQLHTSAASIILGAAMIDDVLGLLLLSLVSGIVLHGHFEWMQLLTILFSSFLFFTGILLCGPWLLKKTIRLLKGFEAADIKLMTSFLFLMVFAWLATCVNLAAIIGAFAAGLVIHDQYFSEGNKSIHDLLSPLESILAPFFFMLIGIQVKMETLMNPTVLMLTLFLLLAAVLGKLVCGLVVSKQENRLLVGIGMLPRGEVGLVFASIGKTYGVFDDQLFSAVILMVVMTTLITPPLMRWRIKAESRHCER